MNVLAWLENKPKVIFNNDLKKENIFKRIPYGIAVREIPEYIYH